MQVQESGVLLQLQKANEKLDKQLQDDGPVKKGILKPSKFGVSKVRNGTAVQLIDKQGEEEEEEDAEGNGKVSKDTLFEKMQSGRISLRDY